MELVWTEGGILFGCAGTLIVCVGYGAWYVFKIIDEKFKEDR